MSRTRQRSVEMPAVWEGCPTCHLPVPLPRRLFRSSWFVSSKGGLLAGTDAVRRARSVASLPLDPAAPHFLQLNTSSLPAPFSEVNEHHRHEDHSTMYRLEGVKA